MFKSSLCKVMKNGMIIVGWAFITYHVLKAIILCQSSRFGRKYDGASHSFSGRYPCRSTPVDTSTQYPLLLGYHGRTLGFGRVSQGGCELSYCHRGDVLAHRGRD